MLLLLMQDSDKEFQRHDTGTPGLLKNFETDDIQVTVNAKATDS
jgi:hypothetical protein